MGLNICKKIIGSLGPYECLYINSKLGKGSKFGFLIFGNKGNEKMKYFKYLQNNNQNYGSEKFLNIKTINSKKKLSTINKISLIKSERDEKFKNSVHSMDFTIKSKIPTFSSWNSDSAPLDEIFQNNDEYSDNNEAPHLKLIPKKKVIRDNYKISSKKNLQIFTKGFFNFFNC